MRVVVVIEAQVKSFLRKLNQIDLDEISDFANGASRSSCTVKAMKTRATRPRISIP